MHAAEESFQNRFLPHVPEVLQLPATHFVWYQDWFYLTNMKPSFSTKQATIGGLMQANHH
jgi:hypothetical protein